VPDFGVARSLSTTTAEFLPDSARGDLSNAQHEVFLDAFDRLEPWFDRRIAAP
jgi:xylulokinase